MNSGLVCIKTDMSMVRCIRILTENGIKLFSMKQNKTGCTFFVCVKDGKRAIKIIRESKSACEIIKDNSVKARVKKVFSRVGICIGMAVLFFMSIFFSDRVVGVSVEGNEWVSTEAIEESVLKVVSLPEKKEKINLSDIEKSILSIDGIALTSVKIDGNTLVVHVSEKTVEYEEKRKTQIVSKYDALVTKIVVLGGKSLVEVGEVVKKGDVLIIDDINNAFGEVYGRVWYTKSLVFTETVMQIVRTGRSYSEYVFPGIEAKSCIYEMYETEENIENIKTVIPLKAKKITYYEVENKVIPFDFESQKERIIAEETEKLKASLTSSEGAKTWYTLKTLDKMTFLDLYYEVEILIS